MTIYHLYAVPLVPVVLLLVGRAINRPGPGWPVAGPVPNPALPCCCLPADDGRFVVDRVCPVHSPNRHIGADR